MQNKMKLIAGPLIFASVFLGILFVFQNCGQRSFESVGQSPSALFTSPGSGMCGLNGTGYGGMVYANKLLSGSCPDGSIIRSRITMSDDNTGVMDRDDCKDIPVKTININAPGTLRSLPIRLPGMVKPYEILVVGGRIFDVGDSSNTVHYCRLEQSDATTGNNRVTEVIVQKATADFKAYFESAEISGGQYSFTGPHYWFVFDRVTSQLRAQLPMLTYSNNAATEPSSFSLQVWATLPKANQANDVHIQTSANPSLVFDQNSLDCYGADPAPSPTPGPTP